MLLILLTCSLIPLLLFSFLYMSLYGQFFNRSLLENTQVQIHQTDRDIDALLARNAQLAQTCASHMTVKSVLSYLPGPVEIQTLQDVLNLSVTGKQDEIAVHVIGKQRAFSSKAVPSQYEYPVLSQKPWFSTVDSYPRTASFFHEPYTDASGSRVLLSVIMPVTDYYNQFVGYVIVDMYSAAFQRLVEHTGENMQCAIWFNDSLLMETGPDALSLPAQVQAMKSYTVQDASHGMAEQDSVYYFWTKGAYNRLQRVYRYNASSLFSLKKTARTILIALVVSMTALTLALSIALSIRQSRPILKLLQAMDEVGKGNLDVRCEVEGKDELSDLAHRFNLLIEQLIQINKDRAAREAEVRRLEIAALQAQINPHFIYNTLGAARSLIRLGKPEKAAEIIGHLSNLLHANFQSPDHLIPIRDDVQLIRSYMTIQNLRFNNRFALRIDLPEEISACLIPSLLLQPVVENAVRHGLEPKTGPGMVQLRGVREGEDVILTVEDDGVGISPEEEARLNASRTSDSHIGYLNVCRRIELQYGPGYSARIQRLPQGTRVTLRIRFCTQEQEGKMCIPS